MQNSFHTPSSFTYELYCKNEGENFFPFWKAKNIPFLKVQNSFHLHSIWSYELKLLTNVNVQKSVLFLKVKVKMQISFHLQGCLFCLFYFVYEDEDEGEDAKNYTKALLFNFVQEEADIFGQKNTRGKNKTSLF